MKITKAMGRACLMDAERIASREAHTGYIFSSYAVGDAITELGWSVADPSMHQSEVLTALCMCAAVAGVKP